ncbi:basic proline-rich protein-like [Homarus americanus]|uniref:basic proline-rich protein-like n=1 Tax=Homarus americanus TaxID=6706 RepID=UPI001C4819F7|nr:basic proline-rich protein-like [Homarus americanus]
MRVSCGPQRGSNEIWDPLMGSKGSSLQKQLVPGPLQGHCPLGPLHLSYQVQSPLWLSQGCRCPQGPLRKSTAPPLPLTRATVPPGSMPGAILWAVVPPGAFPNEAAPPEALPGSSVPLGASRKSDCLPRGPARSSGSPRGPYRGGGARRGPKKDLRVQKQLVPGALQGHCPLGPLHLSYQVQSPLWLSQGCRCPQGPLRKSTAPPLPLPRATVPPGSTCQGPSHGRWCPWSPLPNEVAPQRHPRVVKTLGASRKSDHAPRGPARAVVPPGPYIEACGACKGPKKDPERSAGLLRAAVALGAPKDGSASSGPP